MSTVAPPRPPAPPVHPALVDSEQFIDDHIRRTQRGLKLVDLAAGLLTLAVGLLAFLLAAAVIDHWIVPGGLGPWGRGGLFALLMAGLAWFAWRQFVPLVRSINPVYAAHTIEQTAPSLKNSLLNVLLFRSHRQGMSAKVFHALEQQAAFRLSSAGAEATMDRTGLLRLGYALVAVLAAAALYAVLSPKDMAASVGRVVAPWANIAAPSRVRVLEVEPGDASVARGERVPISATIVGADEDDAVRIRYSTLDEALVGESIAMNRPTGAARYSADLPRGGDAAGVEGVQKDLEYWIEAGDGRSPKYKLTVYTRPTIVVQRVRYKPPTYTGDPPKVVENVGDLFGLEGTEVTIEALANHPIQTANVDFDANGTIDQKMAIDGNRATVTFTLALREDRRTPWHVGYVLRYTTTTGRANEDPVQHRIDVTPDYLPEVSIAQPEEAELVVRAGDVVPITVEARDPDFELQNVGLRGVVRDDEALHVDLLNARHAGLFRQEHRLTLADLQLKPGDVLEYWAVARDNREPLGEEVASEHRRLRIVDPNDPRVPRNPGGQGADDQNQGNGENQDGEQGGDGGAEGGQAGGGTSGEAGEDSGEGTADGGAGEGEPQQGENAQGEGAGGGGDSSEQQPGSEGEGGANSGGGASEGGNRDGSQENSANQGGGQNPGESGNSGGDEGDEASAGDSSGSNGGDQGGGQESVSSAGEEDAEAFDRIRRRMAERQAAEQGGDAEAGQEAESGEEGAGEQSEGDDAESPSEGGDSAAGDSADSDSSNSDSGEGTSEGGQADSSTSRTGNRNQQTGESDGANTESDSESENGESPESANETPAGADGGANPSNGESPTGDDTSGEGGAPEASNKGPRDQAEGDEPSQPGMEGETPTDDTKGRSESDASGDQSGDRAGEGQKGGGQQAENAGEGEAGSHSPTDTGANQSSDPGAGATGTEAGDEQLADGETGESSGDQAGEGSESGEAEGESTQNPGGDQTGAGSQSPGSSSESASESSSEGSESGSDVGGEAGESEGSASSSANGQQSGSPDVGHSNPGDSESTGNDSSDQGDSSQGENSGGSAAPPTGGGTSGGGVDGPGTTSEPGGDDANLAYAREQTDLVLESLEDQLAKGQVDDELLEDLGWSQDDLRNFVDRWKGLFDAAERDGDASDSQERLDAALRSLGPGARGNLQLQGSATADELRDLNDSYRARAPLEYADRVRAYLRGASAADQSDD
jgi:hypothetical protein